MYTLNPTCTRSWAIAGKAAGSP